MNFFSRYRLHILFWTVYFIFWTSFVVLAYHMPVLLTFLSTVIYAIGQGGISYACIYRLTPRYFNTKRYASFILLLLAGLLLSTVFILAGVVGLYMLFKAELGYSLQAEFWYIFMGNIYTLFIIVAIK